MRAVEGRPSAAQKERVGGDRPPIGLSPLGTNEWIGSLSKRLLIFQTPFCVPHSYTSENQIRLR
jgi:hypothetical protein